MGQAPASKRLTFKFRASNRKNKQNCDDFVKKCQGGACKPGLVVSDRTGHAAYLERCASILQHFSVDKYPFNT